MVKHIPNALTLLNVFCGSCALVSIQNGRYTEGYSFLLVSLIADFFDGFAARLLNVKSDMGKELDSLADMVSFGVVPGLILYKLIKTSSLAAQLGDSYWPLAAFIVTAFSCYRLAKFNLDTRQTTDFIGLATPANTLFFIGLLLIKQQNLEGFDALISNTTFLYALIPLSSYLLVSEIPMFSFKFKGFGWAGNEIRFIFAAIAGVLLFWLHESAVALLVVVYILLNIVSNLLKR
ncbi:MAG: CDP-diacylglycerol--serine O-phosphatidyltransferase [Saprospiraceae bacterium]|nr:CDP-diacylglycerol--serine O-phosphatidyltransferase [Saprospiraceae bacterium]